MAADNKTWSRTDDIPAVPWNSKSSKTDIDKNGISLAKDLGTANKFIIQLNLSTDEEIDRMMIRSHQPDKNEEGESS